MSDEGTEPFTVTMQAGLRPRFEAWLASIGWMVGRIPDTDMWITAPTEEAIRATMYLRDSPFNRRPDA